MALFKSRKKKVDAPVAAASPAESIEVMRRRARHRLIGAVVLVLAAVIGFPILFDTQPRPVAVDIPIEIPDRNKVKPLPPPPPQATPAPVATGKVTPPPAPAAPVAQVQPQPAPARAVEKAAPAPAPVEKVAKSEPAPEKKPEARPESKPAPAAADATKARALLEGKPVDVAASGGRYVVQVGAFAEKDKARQAQQKLERAGLKNYTQVADTEEGKRIRVRAGPFASKVEADKAAEKIKGLDLPVRILTL